MSEIASSPSDTTLAYLKLRFVSGLGPRKIKLLVEHFGSAERVLEADAVALAEVEGIGPKLIQAVATGKSSDRAEKELARAQKLGVRILSFDDTGYPAALRQIFDPPAVLYVKGELPKAVRGKLHDIRSIAIVGTRSASAHGLQFSESLAKRLAEAKVTVVSGLALGVDTAAHKGAIDAVSGQTVAVLGSSLDIIYPSQNQTLAKTIHEGRGAVVSEYPFGSRPMASNFPGRNRIINGLARGVVVVEAGKKSGALITADFALEEGRTVFAVPGRVSDPNSVGTLNLLKQGAVLINEPDDIFQEFNWHRQVHAKTPAPDLSAEEALIVSAIEKLGTPLLDDLILETKIETAKLLPILTMLELKSTIQNVAGGRYSLIHSLD